MRGPHCQTATRPPAGPCRWTGSVLSLGLSRIPPDPTFDISLLNQRCELGGSYRLRWLQNIQGVQGAIYPSVPLRDRRLSYNPRLTCRYRWPETVLEVTQNLLWPRAGRMCRKPSPRKRNLLKRSPQRGSGTTNRTCSSVRAATARSAAQKKRGRL